MVSRYTLHQTDACRAKIKTTLLVRRLHDHIEGRVELSPTQVRGIEILLNKTLPNLQATEIKGDVAHYVARLPEPAKDAASWLANSSKAPLLQAVTTPTTVSELVGIEPSSTAKP